MPDLEQEASPIKKVLNETFVTALAEIHVHGILAGIVWVFHHAVSHDSVMVIITAGSGVIFARVWFREKHLKIRLKRGLPSVEKTEAPAAIVATPRPHRRRPRIHHEVTKT